MGSTIPNEVMIELERAAAKAVLNSVTRAESKAACDRMDRMREELRAKHGEMKIAVDLIREIRDEE